MNNDTSNIYVQLWYNNIPYNYSLISLITGTDILCSFRARNGNVVFIYKNVTLINQTITTDNYTNVYDSSYLFRLHHLQILETILLISLLLLKILIFKISNTLAMVRI
jgi:hypothetical protein